MENPPTVYTDNPLKPTKLTHGFYSAIWNILETQIKINTDYYVPNDLGWGAIGRNGKWNGMIGQLERDECDVAVSDFSMTIVRLSAVKFPSPLGVTKLGVFISNRNTDEVKWTAFLSPFNMNIWFALIFILILTPNFAIFLNYKNTDKNLYQCYLEVLQIICQQPLLDKFVPKTNGGFVFYSFMGFISILIVTSYSAALISFLTVENFRLPFTDFKTFADSSYKLLALDKTAQYAFLENSDDPIIQKIFEKRNDTLSTNYGDTLEYLCEADQKFGFYAPFYPADLIRWDKRYCPIVSIPMGLVETISFVVQKESPYLKLIDFK